MIDLDAAVLTAHSEKGNARPTFKKGFGFHPLCVFIDHGPAGTGEMLAIKLRPGNAGSNTASDHITVTKAALAQLPDAKTRPGKGVLVRAGSAGGTHEFIDWFTKRRLSYSVGFTLPHETPDLYRLIPDDLWEPTLDAHGDPRDGAAVVEFTGVVDLGSWPKDMRVIVRRERPHPGAQLRFDGVDGYPLTAFATNTRRGQLQRLELRHRAGHAARTGSGTRKTPDRATSSAGVRPEPDLVRHRRPRRRPDRSGQAFSPTPSMRPAGGNPNASATACSPSPRPSRGTSDASPCTSPAGPAGPASSPLRSAEPGPCPHPAADPPIPPTTMTRGLRRPATAVQHGHCRTRTPESSPRPRQQRQRSTINDPTKDRG